GGARRHRSTCWRWTSSSSRSRRRRSSISSDIPYPSLRRTSTSHGHLPVEGVLAWLKPVYERWLAWKAAADVDARPYVEIRAWDTSRRAQITRTESGQASGRQHQE